MSVLSRLPRLHLTGVCPPARGAVVAQLLHSQPAPVWLVICENTRAAEQLAEDIAFFHRASGAPAAALEVLILPEALPASRDMREAFSASADRVTVLSRLRALHRPPPATRAQRTEPHAAPRAEDTPRVGKPAARVAVATDATTPSLCILTTPAALLQPVPALAQFAEREITLRRGQTQPFAELLEHLRSLDYDCEAVCEAPGHYAVRGGIIDIYPISATKPCRLDFFGDEIEDIRSFDPVTQRSEEVLDAITLSASPRLSLGNSPTGLAAYLPTPAHLVFIEPADLEAAFSELALAPALTPTPASASASASAPASALASAKATVPAGNMTESAGANVAGTGASVAGVAGASPTSGLPALLARASLAFGLADLDETSALFDDPAVSSLTWDTESLHHHRRYPSDDLVAQDRLHAEDEARADFFQQLVAWKKDGYGLALVVSKEGEEQRVRELLDEDHRCKTLQPLFLRGTLNEGFRCTFRAAPPVTSPGDFAPRDPAAPPAPLAATLTWRTLPRRRLGELGGLVLVTETELFGRQRSRRASGPTRATVQRAQVDQLLDFSELVEGDFVVHLQHGIAVFRGLTRLETRDGLREVISVEFDDGVTLHVPLQESHLISRYVGLGKARPQLGKIGSNRWEKTRQAAERATIDLAADLLKIQARREAQPGHAFAPDNTWQKEFEGSFPHTETRDQLKAIEETKGDMERTRPMDRLICGDVGFGKTEVAIRAAFKAVQGGKQVAVLVPTTVLAQQHLNTFRERMAGYPIAVEMVSRFRTRAEHTRVLAATAQGQVDILVGTHRLLQADVMFKDLGLVIIDEEQRFGVKHKERLKSMRATIDVLSMSATPIPRTLYMAMTGARDMSVIETAPTNRLPIQTIVKTYDEKLVVEAIRHETRRGGQVFYLHNRVQTINLVAQRLRELLPELTIGTGHGQMDDVELEKVMTEFVAGTYHVLVCTTIIESGLDIPNCNTIIIEGADRFGLSQLYQLRGRVGRFKHQAYAYLLLHRHTRLVEIARERLNAMRAHNQLGAGFRIALRDLELRGAGNLLGSQQSGHIVGVGFELYCQLLRQSVARLKGEKTAAAVRASVKLDFVFVGESLDSSASALGGQGAARSAAAFEPDDEGEDENTAAAPVPAPTHVPTAAGRAAASSYLAIKNAEQVASGAVTVAQIQARLPAAYIAETRLRIDLYRRLALADTPARLREIESDLVDRFGPFAPEVRALLLITAIRIGAEQKGIISVETASSMLKCLRHSGRHDDYVMRSGRFPRLTAPTALARLEEIITFLDNLPER